MIDITDVASALLAERLAALEAACEEAVQGGEHGVLVLYRSDGWYSVGVDPRVPYGYIFEVEDPT